MTNKLYDLSGKKVWIAGHNGLVGSALVRRLSSIDCSIMTVERKSLDLTRQAETEDWIATNKPDVIFIAAALVGGIQANTARPGDFLYNNLLIAANIIDGTHRADVDRLMFLGSNCMYPRDCAQPMGEESLMSGPLEPSNEGYAMAKLAGMQLCQTYRKQYARHYISVIPTGIYGPGDNLDPAANHVIPAAIQKLHDAKLSGKPVEIWGTGTPRREFMYVDDAADAMIFLMENYDDAAIINIGGGTDVSISELYSQVADVAGYDASFTFDHSKPDGMPLKRLDATKLQKLGWKSSVSLKDGLSKTWSWFIDNRDANMPRKIL